MNRLIVFLALLTTGLGAACNRGAGTGDQPIPLAEIVNNPENPNVVYLKISGRTEADTSILYTAQGLFEGDTLGFVVSLDRDIEPGVNEDGTVRETGFQTGTVKFLRSGEESDRFIEVLAQLWNVPEVASKGFSHEPVIPLSFSSNKVAVDHDKPTTNSFKLFFEPDAEEPGELFFTVDLYRRAVELQEKDAQYREMIVRTLAGMSTADEDDETANLEEGTADSTGSDR